MKYTITRKNLAVTRFMPRGKDADARLKHVHVSRAGTTAFHPQGIMRVSLPDVAQPSTAVIIPQKEADKISTAIWSQARYDIPDEVTEPAVTGPDFLVPRVDSIIPDPDHQAACVTVNGELLLKMLKAACEVSEDSEKTCRLRFYPNEHKLRIDTYRQPGQQEFLGVLCELDYSGDFIPGDFGTGSGKPKPEEKPKAGKGLAFRSDTGRKFRS
jgi:hypothetical protein